jgi:undecaprenyl-diphosphatase
MTELFIIFVLVATASGIVVLRHRRSPLVASLERRLPKRVSLSTLILMLSGLGAAGLFAEIAHEVSQRDTTDLDRTVSLSVHALDCTPMDVLMRVFTFIGSAPFAIPFMLAICIWCVRRGARRAALTFIGVAATAEGLNVILKSYYGRARPNLFEEIATLHSYSFPSGHAMASAAVYGMAAVVITRLEPQLTGVLSFFAPLLVFLIGFSRIFLGVHWMTDVIAGFSAGAFLVFVGMFILERGQSRVPLRVDPTR